MIRSPARACQRPRIRESTDPYICGSHAGTRCTTFRLLGLSVDSVYSHLAWCESIRERFGVTIEFPILEDASLQIAERYGMLQSHHTAISESAASMGITTSDVAGTNARARTTEE